MVPGYLSKKEKRGVENKMTDYRIRKKDLEKIEKNRKSMTEKQWFQVIFLELHEIKDLMREKNKILKLISKEI